MGSWRCPICKRVLGRDDQTIAALIEMYPHFPFCSDRCRLVDLNAWLDADYRIETPQQTPSDPDGRPTTGPNT